MSGRHAGRRRRREQLSEYDAETIRVFAEHNLAIQQERAALFVRQLVMPIVTRTRSLAAGIAMTGVIRAQATPRTRRA